MKGKIIALEASDGCGKATQTAYLYDRLTDEGYRVRQISFPDYSSQSSALIKMYLQGYFGQDPSKVNPYAAATFFAVDRYASFAHEWADWYNNGGIVLADRYTTSNMAHQAIKITNRQERDLFLEWLWDLEFHKFQLPAPDMVIFLDVPPAYSENLIKERMLINNTAIGDIHEADKEYLKKCYDGYKSLAQKYGWVQINCLDDNNLLKSIETIHEEIYQIVRPVLR